MDGKIVNLLNPLPLQDKDKPVSKPSSSPPSQNTVAGFTEPAPPHPAPEADPHVLKNSGIIV